MFNIWNNLECNEKKKQKSRVDSMLSKNVHGMPTAWNLFIEQYRK